MSRIHASFNGAASTSTSRMQVGGGRFDVVGVHHDGDRLELDGGVRHCSPGGPGSVGGFS
jgi:hypothetical protein